MIDSGLVVKQESTNQFVYYELTKKGRDILRQDQSIRIKILLTVSVFTFIGGSFETYRFIKRIILIGGRSSTYDLITGVALIIIALILSNFTFRVWRKTRLTHMEDQSGSVVSIAGVHRLVNVFSGFISQFSLELLIKKQKGGKNT